MPTLLTDIKSNNKKKDKIYGLKGDKVKIIADHGNVLIVEGKERFPVNKSKVV